MIRTVALATLALLALITPVKAGDMPAESYAVEDIRLPRGVAPEIGALAFNSRGELVVVTRRFGVLIGKPGDDPAAFDWRVFCDVSLHNPMGVLIEKDNQLLIPQMAELTRITDADGDGLAETFECVSRAWGISGNYHETNAGPIPYDGGWLIAVGTASHNGPTFDYLRGEYSAAGRRGRNFAAVKWKGTVVKINPDGSAEPFAFGFRANNGICKDPDGRIWVTDNQGDWRGTSPLYHVEKGKFYGHPASLVWDKTWTKSDDPLAYAVENLEEMDEFRARAAVEFPHGMMASSPAEPIVDTTGGAFGPFAGQMFVADVAGSRLIRVMVEEVDGQMQGACVKLIDGNGLRGGGNRLTFSPDGKALYVGQTFRGWGGPAEGLQRIVFKGKAPFEVKTMSLTEDGFVLTFTAPVDPDAAAKADHYKFQRYHYKYTHAYGGPQADKEDVAVTKIDVADDGMSVRITLGEMTPKRIYQLNLAGDLRAADGREIVNRELCYTLNRLRK